MARSAVEAQSLSAVVYVNVTVGTRPAVDTDTQVAAILVVACRAVPTRRQRRTLIHVHRTETTCIYTTVVHGLG